MIDAHKEISVFTQKLIDSGLTVESIVKAYIQTNLLDWRVHAQIIPDYSGYVLLLSLW